MIFLVSTFPNCARHTFALFFFAKRGQTKSHIWSCCTLLYSRGEMEVNWDGNEGRVYPCDGSTRRIWGRPVSASYPTQQTTLRVSCQCSHLKRHHLAELAHTEEKGATRLVPKVTSVGDQVVVCAGWVHITFKRGAAVVVPKRRRLGCRCCREAAS